MRWGSHTLKGGGEDEGRADGKLLNTYHVLCIYPIT